MKTETKTHSQTLGIPWGILWKREKKDLGSHRGQGHHRKPTESMNLETQGLTENEPLTRELSWD